MGAHNNKVSHFLLFWIIHIISVKKIKFSFLPCQKKFSLTFPLVFFLECQLLYLVVSVDSSKDHLPKYKVQSIQTPEL